MAPALFEGFRMTEKNYEIERKWLLQELPEGLQKLPHREIRQGYLCTDPVVRVRRDGDSYWLTYKGRGRMVREEYNLPMTREAYDSLMGKAEGELIEKTRYEMPLDEGLTAEIDLFSGAFSGLAFLEVEFPSREAAEAFRPPAWFGREVTEDARFSNAAMAFGGREAVFSACTAK